MRPGFDRKELEDEKRSSGPEAIQVSRAFIYTLVTSFRCSFVLMGLTCDRVSYHRLLFWPAYAMLCQNSRKPSIHNRQTPVPSSSIYACVVFAAACWGLIFFPSLLKRTLGGGARLRRPSRDRTRTILP